MTPRPAKPCAEFGCPNLIPSGTTHCDGHRKRQWQRYDDARGTSAQRGYDAQWRKVRDMKLARDPLCERCDAEGVTKPTDLVHHIVPIEESPELRLVMDNLESLCVTHHEQEHGRARAEA